MDDRRGRKRGGQILHFVLEGDRERGSEIVLGAFGSTGMVFRDGSVSWSATLVQIEMSFSREICISIYQMDWHNCLYRHS